MILLGVAPLAEGELTSAVLSYQLFAAKRLASVPPVGGQRRGDLTDLTFRLLMTSRKQKPDNACGLAAPQRRWHV